MARGYGTAFPRRNGPGGVGWTVRRIAWELGKKSKWPFEQMFK
jgi:hypothetical protein